MFTRRRPYVLALALFGCGRVEPELSDGNPPDTDVPATGPEQVIAQVVAGWKHACLRTESGEAWCWGELRFNEAHKRPQRIDFGGPVKMLAAGQSSSTCALLRDGSVACRDDRELRRVAGLDDAVTIAMSDSGMGGCAVRAAGGVACWNSMEVQPVAGLDDAIAIAGGQGYCALRKSGTVACWGYSLAIFDVEQSETPVDTPLRDATALTVGMWHACVIQTGGAVTCAGANHSGELGDGRGANSAVGVRVPGLTAVSLAAHFTRTVAVGSDGRVHWWGHSETNNGHGPATPSTPQAIAGIDDAVEAATGTDFGCARTRAGLVKCWGRGDKGELGDGTTGERADAQPIVWPIEEAITAAKPVGPRTDTGIKVGAMTITNPSEYRHELHISLPITYEAEHPGTTVGIVARCEVDGDVLVDSTSVLRPFGFAVGVEFDRKDDVLFAGNPRLPLAPSRCELHVGLSNDDLLIAGPAIGTVCWDGKASPWASCDPPLAAKAVSKTSIEGLATDERDERFGGVDFVLRVHEQPDPAANLVVRASCKTDGGPASDEVVRPLGIPFGVKSGDGILRSVRLFDETPPPGDPSECSLWFDLRVGESGGESIGVACWSYSGFETGAACSSSANRP